MGIRKKLKKALPWWLTGRDEHCSACDHPYAHGLTAHCIGCDRGLCPSCVIVVSGEVFCTDCQGEVGGGD